MAIYQSKFNMTAMSSAPSQIIKKTVPGYTIIVLYLLYLGFALATVKNSGAGDEMGGMGELVRILTLGPAYLIATKVIVKNFSTAIKITSNCKIYLFFFFYSALSAFWSLFPLKVLLYSIHDIGYFMVGIVLIILAKEKGLSYIFKHLSLSTSILIIASILVALLVPKIGVHHTLFRWQGVTGNPNTLGLFCVVNVWSILMYKLLSNGFFNKLICWIGLLIPLFALIGPGRITSVTSLILSMLLIFSIQTLNSLKHSSLQNKFIKIFFATLFLITSILGLYAFLPDIFDIDYLLGKMGRDRSMTGRTSIWDLGWQIFTMKPWLGWGYDGLQSVMQSRHLDISQFHNGYLDLAVRGGIIGFLILLFIIGIMSLNIIKVINKDEILGLAMTSFVFAVLLHNMTEASIMRPTNLYWFAFLLVYLIVCNQKWLFKKSNINEINNG